MRSGASDLLDYYNDTELILIGDGPDQRVQTRWDVCTVGRVPHPYSRRHLSVISERAGQADFSV